MNPYFDWLTEQGFSFFPLLAGSKKPALRWEEFQSRRPTADELSEWRKRGYTNFAIVNGPVSGDLCVLDFEDERDAEVFFGSEYEKLKSITLLVATPHGGVHVYLRCSERVKRQVRIFGDEHPCDLLGEGGYSVAPGSVISCPEGGCSEGDEGTYRPLSGLHIARINDLRAMLKFYAEKAGWPLFIDAGSEEPGAGNAEKRWSDLSDEQIEQLAGALARYWKKGKRNALTVALCGALIHSGISEASAEAVVRRICEIKNDPERADFIRTVKYEYSPRVLSKSRLTGIPTLVRMLKELGAEGGDDASRIVGIITPDNQEDFLPKRIASFILRNYSIASLGGELYVRSERQIYERVRDEKVHSMIYTAFSDEKISTRTLNDAMSYIKALSFQEPSFFEMPKELLPVKNGVLNLASGEFRAYSEADRFTFQLPVEYRPDAVDCPGFKKLVSEIVYGADLPLLQEWFGYNLWRDYPAQKAMLFVGSGSNGKTTLIKVLTALLGQENVSAVPLHELESNRFAPADLYGKLANIVNELPPAALRETRTFKAVTGGDLLRAERKFREPFTFRNYAKLTFATNQLPKVGDDTDAFFRRWLIVSFPFQFSESPQEGEKPADPGLADKIIAGEMPCVLNWALEGLRRLMANNWSFSYGKSVEDTKRDYVRKSDPVRAFIIDALELGSEARVQKSELYRAYVEYCRMNRLPAVSYVSFFKNLAKNGVDVSKEERETVNGTRTRALLGVGLKPKERWGEGDEESSGNQAVEASRDARGQEPGNPIEGAGDEKGGSERRLADLSERGAGAQSAEPGAEPANPEICSRPEESCAWNTHSGARCGMDLPPEILERMKPEGHGCRCGICGAGPWTDSRAALQHFMLEHREVVAKPRESRLFACPVCGAKFLSERDLKEHLAVHGIE